MTWLFFSSVRVHVHHRVRAVKEHVGIHQWDGSDVGGDREGHWTCDGDLDVCVLETASNPGWACGIYLAHAFSGRFQPHHSFGSSERLSCQGRIVCHGQDCLHFLSVSPGTSVVNM